MNLTGQQKDLLLLLVLKHELNGGKPFIFLRSGTRAGLLYPRGDQVIIASDDTDFYQLRQTGLITVSCVPETGLRGKPTAAGIEIVQQRLGAPRVMRQYEFRCPLLAAAPRDQLNQRGAQREHLLNLHIEVAAVRLRELGRLVAQAMHESDKRAAETELLKMGSKSRQKIIDLAETVVTDGVREFAKGLLMSQGRLSVNVGWLHEYTARFASEIRHKLNASPLFQLAPLAPWREDPITQKAIEACEEVLAERRRIESEPSGDKDEDKENLVSQHGHEARTWSPVVQDWEALKSDRKQVSVEHERITESDLRKILAGSCGVEPKDVAWEQIEHAAVELCRHYGRFQIIPIPTVEGSGRDEPQNLTPIQDAAFWTEREDELRLHDTGDNKVLGATWHSWGAYWTFHSGSSSSASVKSVNCFKSQVREAAKGVHSQRGAEAWIDWLDLLRQATDEDTGKYLYATNCPGSLVMSERERERLIAEGEAIPPGELIEFMLTNGGGVERRLYWDIKTTTIENLFENSVHHCMKLRSLSPRPAVQLGNGREAPPPEKTDPLIGNDQTKRTIGDIEAALNQGNRKVAVKLRCKLDGCNISELWRDAFQSRAGKEKTKLTAFNRWQASRKTAPSWADPAMKARLLKK